VLAHELAHLAVGDPLWQLGTDLVCAAWWWQPLAWWARRRLRSAGEAAADEASLLIPGGPQALAASLVALGRRLTVERSFGWLAFHGYSFRSGLGRRVQRLLNLPATNQRLPSRSRWTVAQPALCVLLMAVPVLSTAWAHPRACLDSPSEAASPAGGWWQTSLAAMTLASWLGPAAADATDDPKQLADEAPATVGERSSPARPLGSVDTAEQQRLEQRLHELEAKLYELRAAGKYEESVPAMREIRDIRQKLGLALPPSGLALPEPISREERDKRVRHLRQAAKEMRAAGLEWEARRLLQIAERLSRGGQDPGNRQAPHSDSAGANAVGGKAGSKAPAGNRESRPGSNSPVLGSRLPHSPPPPSPSDLVPVIRALSEQVQEMRQELGEIREQLKHVTGEKPAGPK